MGGCRQTKWHFTSLGKPFRQCGDEIRCLKDVSHCNEMRNYQAHLAHDACALKQTIHFTVPCVGCKHANMIQFSKLRKRHWRFRQGVTFAKNTNVLMRKQSALKKARLQVGQQA